MSINKKSLATATASLGLTVFACAAITPTVFGGTSVFAASTSGNVELNTEISASIAMKIVSPNDIDPNCTPEDGVTYGVANRYASSTGDNSGKVVDTFNGNEGEADELNTNTSCATLSMTPNTFDSTYSDVTIFTNSPSGYALTVQSKENTSPNLVNVADDTQYIEAGVLTEQDGTGEQAGQKVVPGGQNKWAYKTDNGIITDWTAMTASPASIKAYDNYTEGGDTTRVTYGISAGNNPTGKYTTELTYTATMFDGSNPYVGDVEIEDAPNASVSPSSLSIIKGQSKTITITPESGYYLSSFTCPEGYECTGYTTDKDNSASAAAQTITIKNISASSTPVNISFTVAPLKTLADISTMQEMNSAIASGSAAGASKTLTDSRDNNTYTVTKLADGNIWMTQDLKLGGSSALTLTPDDSDVTSNYTLPVENTGMWCTDDYATCYNRSLMIKTGAPNGYLYNWYAATAGTGVYDTGADQNASASICPKGWKLPTKDQYVALDVAYGGDGSIRTNATQRDKFMAAPLNFNYTGYRKGGSILNPSDRAFYWARTALSVTNVYSLLFISNGYFYPQNYNYKYFGFAVRCIAAS